MLALVVNGRRSFIKFRLAISKAFLSLRADKCPYELLSVFLVNPKDIEPQKWLNLDHHVKTTSSPMTSLNMVAWPYYP